MVYYLKAQIEKYHANACGCAVPKEMCTSMPSIVPSSLRIPDCLTPALSTSAVFQSCPLTNPGHEGMDGREAEREWTQGRTRLSDRVF